MSDCGNVSGILAQAALYGSYCFAKNYVPMQALKIHAGVAAINTLAQIFRPFTQQYIGRAHDMTPFILAGLGSYFGGVSLKVNGVSTLLIGSANLAIYHLIEKPSLKRDSHENYSLHRDECVCEKALLLARKGQYDAARNEAKSLDIPSQFALIKIMETLAKIASIQAESGAVEEVGVTNALFEKCYKEWKPHRENAEKDLRKRFFFNHTQVKLQDRVLYAQIQLDLAQGNENCARSRLSGLEKKGPGAWLIASSLIHQHKLSDALAFREDDSLDWYYHEKILLEVIKHQVTSGASTEAWNLIQLLDKDTDAFFKAALCYYKAKIQKDELEGISDKLVELKNKIAARPLVDLRNIFYCPGGTNNYFIKEAALLFVEMRNFEQAREFMAQVNDPFFQCEILCEMGRQHLSNREDAIRLLEEAYQKVEVFQDASTIRSVGGIAQVYVDLGYDEKARSLLISLQESVDARGYIAEKKDLANEISTVTFKQVRRGHLEEAKQTARIQSIPCLYAALLYDIAKELIQADKEQEGKSIFDEAEVCAFHHIYDLDVWI